LLGWTVQAWLCVYFWNHDVGIGGGPMLLFGPPLVMFGSLVLFHLTAAVARDRDAPRSRLSLGRGTLRVVGLVTMLASCPIGLWAWVQWHKSAREALPPYRRYSDFRVPTELHAIAWLLTLLTIAVFFYTIRHQVRQVKSWV
jgi:hypothetical protein